MENDYLECIEDMDYSLGTYQEKHDIPRLNLTAEPSSVKWKYISFDVRYTSIVGLTDEKMIGEISKITSMDLMKGVLLENIWKITEKASSLSKIISEDRDNEQ